MYSESTLPKLDSVPLIRKSVATLTRKGAEALTRESAKYGWPAIKGVQMQFASKTKFLRGRIVWAGERTEIARVARLLFASSILAKNVESFNSLDWTELCLLRGLFEFPALSGLIARDIYNLFVYIKGVASEDSREELRNKLYIRCAGFCEADTHAEELGLGKTLGLTADDMHEIIPRSALPRDKQRILWMPGNTLFLSREYHMDFPRSIHNVGWGEWGMDLLFLVRTNQEIADFVEAWRAVCRHEEPAINEMERRLQR